MRLPLTNTRQKKKIGEAALPTIARTMKIKFALYGPNLGASSILTLLEVSLLLFEIP